MESSTIVEERELALLEQWQEPRWETMIAEMPGELDRMAQEHGALQRQRKVRGAANLLRLVLAYAVCDWPLRLVGAWATIQGIANLSDVALLYRFRQCGPWLGQLLGRVLQQRSSLLQQMGGVRLRIVDATVVSRPGSRGTDWRVHLSLDLGRVSLDGIEITDARGGESLARFSPRADEIYVADRGYAYTSSLGAWLTTQARLVARINWQNLPLNNQQGRRINLIGWMKGISTLQEQRVILPTPQGDFPMRLIAYPLSTTDAARAREKQRKQARKKGKNPSPDAYLAAGFVLLLTNLPSETWEINRVVYLYRLRWQIELHIKRLKSLLQLDHLRAQDPRLAQTYLLGKLLAAVWLDQLVQHAEEQQPQLGQSLQRPVSLWRLSSLLWIGLQDMIVGAFSLARILKAIPLLARYLCDSPRSRTNQMAWARRFMARLSNV
jgi:hypothetical protein